MMRMRGARVEVIPRRYLPGLGDLPHTSSYADQLRGPTEDVVDHLLSELSGEGVLLARVIATEQSHRFRCITVNARWRRLRLHAVAEPRSLRRQRVTGFRQRLEHRRPRKSTQRDR